MTRPHPAIRYLVIVAWCAIVLGSLFRLTQLSTRALFVDEAITQIRVAGYTYAGLVRVLYDGRPRTVAALRRVAAVDASSSPQRLIASLALEDAQHPPLFYLAELGAVRVLGTALWAWRFLPALFGLLTIPAAYALARVLFGSASAGLLAAALFAVSPVERIYAQQAREYSLLTLLILLATLVAVVAVRANALRWWALYGVVVAAGLYASPFMGYAVAAHAVFVFGAARGARWPTFARFAGATAAALVAYAPWLDQMAIHRSQIVDTNAWSGTPWPISRLAAKWVFNAGATFFDLEYIDLRWAIVLVVVAVVAAVAIVAGFRQADARARWCLGAGIAVPALLLVLPDLVFREHRSAVARYGLPVFALLPIVIGRGLLGRPIAATIMLAAGLGACAVASTHASWWDNDTNGDDLHIAAAINAVPHAQVISTVEPPEVIAFARVLDGDVRVSVSAQLADTRFTAGDPLFVLRPTPSDLRALAARTGLRFEAVPYERALTAHQIGARIAGADDVGADGTAADLYRAVGVSR